MTEDEMVGSHHQLNGHEFEQIWEIVKDREAWQATVPGVLKSQTLLCMFTSRQHKHGSSYLCLYTVSCLKQRVRPGGLYISRSLEEIMLLHGRKDCS